MPRTSQKRKETKQTGLVAVGNSRSVAQKNLMQKCADANSCPFCKINREVNPKDLRVGKYWRVMPCAFPYHEHTHHILLMTIRHITDIRKVTPAMWAEWGRLNNWVIRKFNIPGGGIVIRFGDFKYNAGTIAHLHNHIQVPNGKRFSLGVFCKDPDLIEFFQKADAKYKKLQEAKAKKHPKTNKKK